MRFPFTFIGVLLVAIGAWACIYLITHPGLDGFSVGLAAGTAVLCFASGLYVLIRRVVRGPQH